MYIMGLLEAYMVWVYDLYGIFINVENSHVKIHSLKLNVTKYKQGDIVSNFSYLVLFIY